MPGETDLTKLLGHMNPELNPGEYFFCVCESMAAAIKREPVGMFQEREGVSAILPKDQVNEAGLRHSNGMAWITLNVHSSLEAVGLTAAISAALTGANISCNVVAGYYHDHLFVPVNEASRAMRVLEILAGSE
jgi:hypothetical protein